MAPIGYLEGSLERHKPVSGAEDLFLVVVMIDDFSLPHDAPRPPLQ